MSFSDKAIKCLEIFFQNSKQVTISSFARLVRYFGPFDNNLSARIEEICSQKYFYGFVKEDGAFKRPVANKDFFFVRFASSDNGSFTIVIVEQVKLSVKRIVENYDPKNFKVYFQYNGCKYNKLVDVIEKNYFGIPLPGSIYHSVFMPPIKMGYEWKL